MKLKRIKFDEGCSIKYTINREKSKIKAKFHSGWNSGYLGNPAGSLVDTGNAIEIEVDGIDIKLDYHQANVVLNLLKYHNKHLEVKV